MSELQMLDIFISVVFGLVGLAGIFWGVAEWVNMNRSK